LLQLCSVLNTLLIWVIVKHSPAELQAYKKVLLQTAILDTGFIFLCFCVQPVILVFSGVYTE